MVLGVVSSFNEAGADGRPSTLKLLVELQSLRAQGSSDAGVPPAVTPPTEIAPTDIEDDVPFSELNEALTEARSRLAELTKAAEIAKVAGELRQELAATKQLNEQLEAALAQANADITELQTANQAITRQADGAQLSAADASAQVKRLDEELVAMRWQNSQLSTSLKRAEDAASEANQKLETSSGELTLKIETLTSDLEKKASEAARLDEELIITRESAQIAEQRGAELEEQLKVSQGNVTAAEAQLAELAKDLDAATGELSGARSDAAANRQGMEEMSIALAAAEQEKAVLREQFAVNREEADQLRNRLSAAESQLSRVSASNSDLKQQVEVLRTAAGEATDAARLNLIAVNNQINEINAALATAKGDELLTPSGGPANEQNIAVDGNARAAEARPTEVAAPASDAWVPPLTPARATAIGIEQQQQLIAAAAANVPASAPPEVSNRQRAGSPLANRVDPTRAEGIPPREAAPTEATALVAGLSSDRQQRAGELFADLNVRTEPRGLTMTVPGTILFAVNSETIEPDAYETLARVAEVIQLYEDRQILVIGHTDAVGDDGYNQQLSERRADLVKNYFVNEFDVVGDRLLAQGLGETRPIASNATAEGRDTNRRVEVVVLNQLGGQ